MKFKIIQNYKAEYINAQFENFIKEKEIIDIKVNIEKDVRGNLYVILITYKDIKI